MASAGLAPSDPKIEHLNINTRPDCPIAYAFTKLTSDPDKGGSVTSIHKPAILLVFVNGLVLPQISWMPTVKMLQSTVKQQLFSSEALEIAMFTYDRYGQAQSRPSSSPPEKHDMLDTVTDMRCLLETIVLKYYGHPTSPAGSDTSPPRDSIYPTLIFISHSIGVPLTRLYVGSLLDFLTSSTSPSQKYTHPTQIPLLNLLPKAHLFLDPNVAEIDQISMFPDPDSPDLNPAVLPSDSTVQDLILQRKIALERFHPSVPNAENLDRSTTPQLLPTPQKPSFVFTTTTDKKVEVPYLTVLAHDPEAFAQEGFKMAGVPRGITLTFTQPVWEEHNRGLLDVVSRSGKEGDIEGKEEGWYYGNGKKEVIYAQGAGHFIQKDRPDLVVEEIWRLVGRILE